MSDGARLRVVVVGAGNWGLRHARILSARPDVDFRAVAGRTPERTRARAERFRVRAYTDVGEMLAAERPDLVCLSLETQCHVPGLAAAARRLGSATRAGSQKASAPRAGKESPWRSGSSSRGILRQNSVRAT